MASANAYLSKEQFLCSICLDIFNEPVSTPCGHNYCKNCIKSYWTISDVNQCPLCQETFHGVPELRVNIEFRDMLEVFKRTFVACDDSGPPARPGEVPCDLCHGMKRKALKSCLVCLASYCNVHLEPHQMVQAFKWHKLIDPVVTLEDRMCKKHNKMIEFFCREDQSGVCVLCLRDDHVNHNAVSLEEELRERKTNVERMKKKVKRALSEKRSMAERIQNSVIQGRQEVEKIKAETIKAFDVLVALIETRKVKLIELLGKKNKAAEQKAEELFSQLQLEMVENDQTITKLEELSETEDDFRLLQGLPSVSSSSEAKHHFSARVQPLLCLETVRSAVAKMKEMLNEEMDIVMGEVELVDKEETLEEPLHMQTGKEFNDQLGRIQKQYEVKVTLDLNTAHPSLIISGDRKQVRDGGRKRKVPDNPTRFDFFHFVLGNEGFSSGKFYYEVAVKGQTGWEIGVARESISKKGFDLSLSPENGCWTLGSYWEWCQGNANPPVKLPLSKKPEKVGVFVDYEGGLVSFYDVDTRAQIFSFTGCAFTASVPSQSNTSAPYVYTGTLAKTRIIPLFRPSGEERSDPLRITPVRLKKPVC